MYFTDSGLDIVAVADLDGQHHKVLHRTGLVKLVDDGQYGAPTGPSGEWTGMVKELMDTVSAVTSLTSADSKQAG